MISEAERAAKAAQRLADVRGKHYRSARAAAHENGWPESTYRAHESNGRTFGLDDAVKYARRYGVDPLFLYYGNSLGTKELPAPSTVQIGNLPIKGEVRAGAWLEIDEQWDGYDGTIPAVADPRYNAPQYALKVVGDSMNLVFPEGQYVICASLAEMGRDAQNGDLVIVERHRGGLIEATVKLFDTSGNEPVLRPRSTNKAHRPLRINHQPAETDVFITGLVVGRYEPL